MRIVASITVCAILSCLASGLPLPPILAGSIGGNIATTASDFCPGTNGHYSWTQDEHGQQGHQVDNWFMSPCSQAPAPGHSTPVYLQIVNSTAGYTPVHFTHIAQNWHPTTAAGDVFQANFTQESAEGAWARVTATCDASVPVGKIMSNGLIYQVENPFHSCCATWEIPIKINCGGFCPGAAGEYTWSQKEHGPLDNGQPTDNWLLSPCSKVTPEGKSTPVFMELLSSTANYDTVRLTQFAKNWTQVSGKSGVWVANLTSEPHRFPLEGHSWVEVTATCDSSIPAGKVEANGLAYQNINQFYECCATWRVPIKVNCDGGNGPVTTTAAPTTMAPPTPAPVPADCGQYKSCSDCTTSSSGTCGFCLTTKECLSGTSIGPNSGSCPNTQTNWKWFSSEC